MPQRHEDTKIHKELIFNNLDLVFPIAIGIAPLCLSGKKGLIGADSNLILNKQNTILVDYDFGMVPKICEICDSNGFANYF